MHVIHASHPDHALRMGIQHLAVFGTRTDSRNGPVLVAPGPVATVFANPRQRVSFAPLRDANPFFHLMEALWMLAGRNDAAYPARFAGQIAQYSDDGMTLNGAYGHRWREHFGYDQLLPIVEELKSNPDTRRCVLSMWDPRDDLDAAVHGSKDVPCNTQVYFRARLGYLDMTVTNRSNDMVWGAYGANVVHMSVLHEVMAWYAGLKLGTYVQFSHNFHAYIERPDTQRLFKAPADAVQSYPAEPFEMCDKEFGAGRVGLESYLSEVEEFVAKGRAGDNVFLRTVAEPLLVAHTAHKDGATDYGRRLLRAATEHSEHRVDWLVAGEAWLARRLAGQQRRRED